MKKDYIEEIIEILEKIDDIENLIAICTFAKWYKKGE